MFMRVDQLQAELSSRKGQSNAAAALRELIGGKYGEMSALNNYMFQRFTSAGGLNRTSMMISARVAGVDAHTGACVP